MTWPDDVNALNISGECQTWAMRFSAKRRANASDEELARALHNMVLSFQRMERKLNRQMREGCDG